MIMIERLRLPDLIAIIAITTAPAGCDTDAPTDSEAVPSSSIDQEASPERSRRRDTLPEARTVRNSAAAAARRRVRELGGRIESGLHGGSSHTCRLDQQGDITCWGYIRPAPFVTEPIELRRPMDTGDDLPPPVDFQQISTGGDHVCGVVLAPHDDCRTYPDLPVAVGGPCPYERGDVVCWGNYTDGQAEEPQGNYREVAAGEAHTCALPINGRPVECWGADKEGQASPPPRRLETLSAGYEHTCGLTVEGEAVCWGNNAYGQLEAPETTFEQIDAGRHYNCGITTEGSIRCWGDDTAGGMPPPSGEFERVVAGYLHACALAEDGTVTCWGDNSGDVRCNGREAGGQTEAPDSEFTDITAGGSHTCALRAEDDRTICWGDDLYGEAHPPDGTYLSSADSDQSGHLPKMGSHR